MRDRCAVPRTLFQCVCTQHRNRIGRLSPFSEYAPTASRFKLNSFATIKLVQSPLDARKPPVRGWQSSQITLCAASHEHQRERRLPTRIARPISVAEATSSHCSADPVHSYAPDRSCYFPPADERKGKTKAESDRHLGKSTVTHWSHALPRSSRHDGGVKAEKRRRHEDYWRGALGVRTLGELTSEKYTERMDFRFAGV